VDDAPLLLLAAAAVAASWYAFAFSTAKATTMTEACEPQKAQRHLEGSHHYGEISLN